MTNNSFEEDFPSLQIPFPIDRGDKIIEIPEKYFSICCLDKQRVKEAIYKCSKGNPDAYHCDGIALLKELGLNDEGE